MFLSMISVSGKPAVIEFDRVEKMLEVQRGYHKTIIEKGFSGIFRVASFCTWIDGVLEWFYDV
jgi:hypothetical protein